MKKACVAAVLTIILGVFFGLKGSPMFIEYLNTIGFLNWLSENEWFVGLIVFAPLVFIILYYIIHSSKKGDMS